MVSFTVRMQFRPADRQRIDDALRALAQHSRQEPGCVSYVPHRVEAEPDTVLIYEQYRDGAALDAHRATEHFARWATGVLYQHMVERSVEELEALA